MSNKCESPFKFFKVTKNQSLNDVALVLKVPPSIIIKMNNLTEEIKNGDVLFYQKSYNLCVVDFEFLQNKSPQELQALYALNGVSYFYLGQIIAI